MFWYLKVIWDTIKNFSDWINFVPKCVTWFVGTCVGAVNWVSDNLFAYLPSEIISTVIFAMTCSIALKLVKRG